MYEENVMYGARSSMDRAGFTAARSRGAVDTAPLCAKEVIYAGASSMQRFATLPPQ